MHSRKPSHKAGRGGIATALGMFALLAALVPCSYAWISPGSATRAGGSMSAASNYYTYILLQNPGGQDAEVTLTYMIEGEESTGETVVVSPSSRKTVCLNESVGPGLNVSTRVTSDVPIVAERAVYFDSWGRSGGHDSIGAVEPSANWYLAEGYTAEQFDTWILVQNPDDDAASVNVTFMREDGSTLPVAMEVAARSRSTIHVDEIRGLESCEVSTQVRADRGVIAERAMYFDYQGRSGGHDSIGTSRASTTWYLAEGYTVGDFDTWILLQNPTGTPATVFVNFMKPDGSTIVRGYPVGARSRYTIGVDSINGLEATEVSTYIESEGVPIIAERSMYFDYMGVWPGGHDTIAVDSPSFEWYFAEGYTGL